MQMLEQRKLNQLLNVRYSGLLEENVFGYVQIRKDKNLIKKYRPPYNVMLKDDKTYPYIRVTVQEDFQTDVAG